MGHTVKVRLKPDGTTEVSVDGVAGGSCKDVTRALEHALGQTTDDKKTPDFHLVDQPGVQIEQGGSS